MFVKVGTDGVGKERSSTLLHVVGDGDWICQGWSSRDMEHVFIYGSKLLKGKRGAGKWNAAYMSS